MIELHDYGSMEVHKALKLARYLEEAGPESREERAIVELAVELQRTLTHGSLKAASWQHALDAFTGRQPRLPGEAAQKVLDALTRFGSTEDEGAPTCCSCGYDYVLAPGSERTALCPSCAHEAVDTLANELTVFQELWRNLRVHVDQYPEHAELKAQLERVTRERDEALRWSNFHDRQAQRVMRDRDSIARERNEAEREREEARGERDALRAELDAFAAARDPSMDSLRKLNKDLHEQWQNEAGRANTLAKQLHAALDTLEKAVHENEAANALLAEEKLKRDDLVEQVRSMHAENERASRRPPAVHRGEGYRVIIELDEPRGES